MLFAQAPRYGIAIYALIAYVWNRGFNWSKYTRESFFTNVTLILMAFFVILFLISLLKFFLACIIYVPLIIDIQGNLKEYVCHKIDKRIAELIAYSDQLKLEAGGNRTTEIELDRFGAIKKKPTLPAFATVKSLDHKSTIGDHNSEYFNNDEFDSLQVHDPNTGRNGTKYAYNPEIPFMPPKRSPPKANTSHPTVF